MHSALTATGLLAALLAVMPCRADVSPLEIHAGCERDFKPYSLVDERGEPAGFGGEFLRAAAQDLGLTVRFTPSTWDADLLEQLNEGLLIVKENREYDRIYEKRLSDDDPWMRYKDYSAPAAVVVAFLGLFAATGLFVLREMVRRRTAELDEKNMLLHRAGAELEARVTERTVALSQANADLQREIAERELAERHAEHLASFPLMNPSPVIEVDSSGRVTFANPATAQVLRSLGRDTGLEQLFLPADFEQILTGSAQPSAGSLRREVAIADRVFAVTAFPVAEPRRLRVYAYEITERTRAEDALRESETRYRVLFEANPNPICVIDAETLQFLAVNDAAVHAYGWSREEFLSRGMLDVCPPEGQAPARLAIERSAGAREKKIGVLRHTRKDGQPIDMEITINAIVFGGRTARLCAMTDVTQRRRAERAQCESEERFSVLFEAAPIALALASPFDGALVDVNQAWLNLFGFARKEAVLGKSTVELGLVLEPQIPARVLSVFRKGSVREEEVMVRSTTGGERILLVDMHVVSIGGGTLLLSASVDITERKRMEVELRRGQEDMARAQEVGQIGSWRLDTRCNVLTWSDTNHRIFGVPKGKPLSYESFMDTVHPDDRAAVDRAWKAGLAGEPYDIEHRILAGGRLKWVRERAFLEFDSDGALLGGFGITQEITERKRAEQELRDLNETLEQRVTERTAEVRRQADQLRALAAQLAQVEQRERRRLAGILHDHIQQLLVVACMQLDVIKRDPNPERLRAAAVSADAVLHEAMEASRSLAIDLSPPVLHEAGLIGGLNWLAARMGEKNAFTVNLKADNTAEPADEETRLMLFECARELLLNTMKHAGATEALIVLRRTLEGCIELTVRDEGQGFEPDALERRQGGTMTFGLFSIRERLAHIGGRMEIDTAPGKGTQVSLTVPFGDAALAEAVRGAPIMAERRKKLRVRSKAEPCRILIVDDHKIMREGLRGLLEFERGFEVAGEAADGDSGVDLARQLLPDIVIVDVNLAGGSGVEVTRRILEENSQIKVIGLSMFDDQEVRRAMQEAGATAYFTKGGPSEDLIAALRTCVPRATEGSGTHPDSSERSRGEGDPRVAGHR